MSAPKSPFYRNAFLYQGVHVMSGCTLHKLLTDGKMEEAAKQHKETKNAETELLKRLP